jgi:hypothetical protein
LFINIIGDTFIALRVCIYNPKIRYDENHVQKVDEINSQTDVFPFMSLFKGVFPERFQKEVWQQFADSPKVIRAIT